MSERVVVPRRVAIVGAGPAGVACGRALTRAGHTPTLFERGDEFGGIWAPNAPNKVVYQNLVTNIPTICMQGFELDFPSHMPSYVSAADLGRYLCSYADTFGIRQLTRFGTHVTSVRPLRTEAEEEHGVTSWRVSWVSAGMGEGSVGASKAESAQDFDAVVMATGHYEVPYEPTVPGQNEWLESSPAPGVRRVVQAREYTEASPYASRAILVVGGRSSAVDIAREVRPVASWLYVLDKACRAPHTEGSCTHVPFGAELTKDGHLQLEGTVLPGPPVDDLILATGYLYAFDCLEGVELDFGPSRRYVAPVHMHVVHARRPSLCFLGLPLSVPVPMPLFEAQSLFIATHFSQQLLGNGEAGRAEREAWVAARRAAVGDRTMDMHFLANESWRYCRDLVRLSGLAGPAYDAYAARLAIVAEVYEDRVRKKPTRPWSDDSYRRCEYSVDWSAGTWTCKDRVKAAL